MAILSKDRAEGKEAGHEEIGYEKLMDYELSCLITVTCEVNSLSLSVLLTQAEIMQRQLEYNSLLNWEVALK